MKECDERKSHLSSKLHIIDISSDIEKHPVTKTFTTRHYTSPNYTSLHYTSRHFTFSHLNFTQLHFNTLTSGLSPFKFPTAPFHLTSLHFTSLHFTFRWFSPTSISVYARTKICYNEGGSRTSYINSGIPHYIYMKVKVKWSLYRPGVAQRVGRGLALLFHDHGTRRGWGVVTPRPHFIPGKDPVPILQEAGWAPGPVWTGGKISSPPGFDPGPSSP